MDNKKSRFGIGLVVGTVLGALAGLFLAPQSGKETREAVLKKVEELKKELEKMEIDKKVKEIWGEVNEEGRKMYKKASKDLSKKLELVQDKWDQLDKEKYIKMVEDVIESVRKDTSTTPAKLEKLKKAFLRDWEKIMEVKSVKK
ncbi:hypothetical protein A2866_01930 [Candidatus Roizmanbacteria bacterium RIFCSPHIGHO2_01_FULL_39_8]|uniref:Gas vesicle protein n=3 Tax=Candidatus Roizmaniibacteriota TaxID=1752723 RepID=A0A1F7GQ35_9BACT|nr:MAG: hypothetical protein A2866_01930 [Candidatus Roizmanbacteria bacterium RIFCSPHIGHO2_01_FULL_39_8]OGK27777.1 MAG: hypothetical protein A3C28_03955 [Candidatus Roizmanbacteria bacterium RIFCSPHIGHO2_02_FULL_39_9]OGK37866.1 MAG: hypothetical protein A3F60_03305 [Candidatus Roizmanbacteria bacterium RIFCSPHIGHO2_12_FULL_39_8]